MRYRLPVFTCCLLAAHAASAAPETPLNRTPAIFYSGPPTGASLSTTGASTTSSSATIHLDPSGQLQGNNNQAIPPFGTSTLNPPVDNHDNRVYPPTDEQSATLSNAQSAH